MTRSVTGAADVLPALLTEADVVATVETTTTDVDDWLDGANEKLLVGELEAMTVDVASDVVKIEAEVSEKDENGPAEETTDAEPDVKALEVVNTPTTN